MAAAPNQIHIDLDVSRARSRVKRMRREAQELDRDLAILEERLGGLAAKLKPFHITLEVVERA